MSHPELEGYEPVDGDSRFVRRRRVMRIVVIVALAALVLPAVLSTGAVASGTAARVCSIYAQSFDRNAAGEARFELFGPGGPGWQCYAVLTPGHEQPLGNLGVIPAMPTVPPGVRI